jgi:hypothetical protein
MTPGVEMVDTTISSSTDYRKIEKDLILTITGDMAEIVSQMVIGIGTIVDLSHLLHIMLKEGIINQIKGDLGPSRTQMRSTSETPIFLHQEAAVEEEIKETRLVANTNEMVEIKMNQRILDLQMLTQILDSHIHHLYMMTKRARALIIRNQELKSLEIKIATQWATKEKATF